MLIFLFFKSYLLIVRPNFKLIKSSKAIKLKCGQFLFINISKKVQKVSLSFYI